jgi:hypothetical protein
MYNALIVRFATYMSIIVATYNQAQFADYRDCNVYWRIMCCRSWLQRTLTHYSDDSGCVEFSDTMYWWFWFQSIIKPKLSMILLKTYHQARCANDSGCNVYSSTMCWWFWLQGILKPNVLMIRSATSAPAQSAFDSGYNVYSHPMCRWCRLQRIIKPF